MSLRELFVIMVLVGSSMASWKIQGNLVKNTGAVHDVTLTSVSPDVAFLDIYDAQKVVEQLIVYIPETNKVFDRICIIEQENQTSALYESCHVLVGLKNRVIPTHVVKPCEGRHVVQLFSVPCQEEKDESTHMRVKRQSPSICLYYKQESYTTNERYCCRFSWGRCTRYCYRTRTAYRRVCDFSRIRDRIHRIPRIPRITLRPPVITFPPITPPHVTPPGIRRPDVDVIQPINRLRNIGRNIRDRINPMKW